MKKRKTPQIWKCFVVFNARGIFLHGFLSYWYFSNNHELNVFGTTCILKTCVEAWKIIESPCRRVCLDVICWLLCKRCCLNGGFLLIYSLPKVCSLFFKQDAQFFFPLFLCTCKKDCFAWQFFWEKFLPPGEDTSLFYADELTFENIEWSSKPYRWCGWVKNELSDPCPTTRGCPEWCCKHAYCTWKKLNWLSPVMRFEWHDRNKK